jgi:hypothetical protein
MEFVIIEKNDIEIIRSHFAGNSLLKFLNNSNYLELFISKNDIIKINFNENIYYLNFKEFYEIYSYGIKTLYTTTFESEYYFFFIDIIQFYNLHFIKSIFIYKKT